VLAAVALMMRHTTLPRSWRGTRQHHATVLCGISETSRPIPKADPLTSARPCLSCTDAPGTCSMQIVAHSQALDFVAKGHPAAWVERLRNMTPPRSRRRRAAADQSFLEVVT
jgi:hypothetical protein